MLKGNRYFTLSCFFGLAAFVLSVYLKDGTIFTAVGTVALGGGHLTNVAERFNPQVDESEK